MPTIIDKYFSDLDETQKSRFDALGAIYKELNSKINLISRNDIDNLYEHHVLHSLAITKAVDFKDDQNVLDIGSGGGFPGIPLAIRLPATNFLLVDSIGKKVDAIQQIITKLGLENVVAKQIRVEVLQEQFDWAVCRAVGRLDKVWSWVKDEINFSNNSQNGLLYLKGGDFSGEIPADVSVKEWPISQLFPGIEYFEQKSLLLLYPKRDNKY